MTQQVKKLMSKFADVNFLTGKEHSFQVYALEYNDGNYCGPVGITYPSPFGEPYFIAEVSVRIDPKGGKMLYKHAFKLDLASLKYELEKINTKSAKTLILPERIANVLQERYHEVADYLIDYNGKMDYYREIAEILSKSIGPSVAPDFGI